MPKKSRTLLSIAHSYCVALNRRLAHEMARVGNESWDVTAVTPEAFHGDLSWITVRHDPDEPCRLETVPTHLSSRVHVMFYGRRLRHILHKSWDVVHCWEEPYILAGGQIAWNCPSDARLVVSTFQNQPKRYPPPFCWIEKYAMQRSSGWIAFGHTIHDNLAKRKPYDDKPRRVIPLGVDTSHFTPNTETGNKIRHRLDWTDSSIPVVGFLGRFIPAKGLDLLMRILDRQSTPWRALIVGGGPMEFQLRQWAGQHGNRVRIVTGVQHDDVPPYINAMDVMCAPSQTTPQWREQLGRMLLEAFACGVPVLASDSGEIPYVMADAGVIVAEKDEDQWAKRLSELLENNSMRSELGAKGLERARTVFAWPRIARQHIEFFDQLLDRKSV